MVSLLNEPPGKLILFLIQSDNLCILIKCLDYLLWMQLLSLVLILSCYICFICFYLSAFGLSLFYTFIFFVILSITFSFCHFNALVLQFNSVQSLSRVRLFVTPWTEAHQASNSSPLCQWCHPTISSSAVPFSSCLQPFPVSRSFPLSQFFILGGQSIGVSASAWVLRVKL